MKIILFGDIMGRPGRDAVKAFLPELKAEFNPDLVIANGENLAHGKGLTTETATEMINAGVDLFTSGNHIFDRQDGLDIFADQKLKDRVLRPANYPTGTVGPGAKFLTIGTKNVLVLNLLGRVFSRVLTDDPFRTFDRLMKEFAPLRPDVVLVDFHAEATSEKQAFGWHVDGRATAVWGTHTHVPTRDERLLPGGTAYVSDIGMCGLLNGIIGADREPVLRHFLTQMPLRIELTESGPIVADAFILDIKGGRAVSIEHRRKIVEA